MFDSLLSLNGDVTLKCECLVIGSGAGGALTANYLAGRGRDVLVAEEGPYVRNDAELKGVKDAFPKMWRNGGIMPVFGNCKLIFAEGRCVGGTTMINSGLIAGVSEETVAGWVRRNAIENLDFETLDRYKKIIESQLNIRQLDYKTNPSDGLFRKGAHACGFKGIDVPVAAGVIEGGVKKNNAVETHLRKAAESGARIISDCRIIKIRLEGDKATEAEAFYVNIKGERNRLRIIFKKLFICAGAIQTPLLLRRSKLKKNVGNSVRFHPTLRVAAEFDFPVNAYSSELSSYQIKEFAPEISMGASASSTPFLASILSLNWDENRSSIGKLNNMASYYVLTRSYSQGLVRNLSPSGESYFIKYNLNNAELKNLSFGFARLCELLFKAGAKRLYPSVQGMPFIEEQKASDNYLKDHLPLKNLNLMSVHSFDSCPMGENKYICAADSYGKLHNIKNVYLNDSSILPNTNGVNPQGTLMSMALRNLEYNFGSG